MNQLFYKYKNCDWEGSSTVFQMMKFSTVMLVQLVGDLSGAG
jgi:hypothetical protein